MIHDGTYSFPRTRGDVPFDKNNPAQFELFSPYTRGCSAHCPLGRFSGYVFPVHAGMFRRAAGGLR